MKAHGNEGFKYTANYAEAWGVSPIIADAIRNASTKDEAIDIILKMPRVQITPDELRSIGFEPDDDWHTEAGCGTYQSENGLILSVGPFTIALYRLIKSGAAKHYIEPKTHSPKNLEELLAILRWVKLPKKFPLPKECFDAPTERVG